MTDKQFLIKASEARSLLYLGGFITEKQNSAIAEKLIKYRDKKKIAFTPKTAPAKRDK